jgi:hypothetical protein
MRIDKKELEDLLLKLDKLLKNTNLPPDSDSRKKIQSAALEIEKLISKSKPQPRKINTGSSLFCKYGGYSKF